MSIFDSLSREKKKQVDRHGQHLFVELSSYIHLNERTYCIECHSFIFFKFDWRVQWMKARYTSLKSSRLISPTRKLFLVTWSMAARYSSDPMFLPNYKLYQKYFLENIGDVCRRDFIRICSFDALNSYFHKSAILLSKSDPNHFGGGRIQHSLPFSLKLTCWQTKQLRIIKHLSGGFAVNFYFERSFRCSWPSAENLASSSIQVPPNGKVLSPYVMN